jgi:hypothetical protein
MCLLRKLYQLVLPTLEGTALRGRKDFPEGTDEEQLLRDYGDRDRIAHGLS